MSNDTFSPKHMDAANERYELEKEAAIRAKFGPRTSPTCADAPDLYLSDEMVNDSLRNGGNAEVFQTNIAATIDSGKVVALGCSEAPGQVFRTSGEFNTWYENLRDS